MNLVHFILIGFRLFIRLFEFKFRGQKIQSIKLIILLVMNKFLINSNTYKLMVTINIGV
jgi:uncharacterized membrane protein